MHTCGELTITCAKCLTEIVSPMCEIKANNCLVCPECVNENIVDVEKIQRQQQIIMAKVFGNPPSNPNLN